MDPFAAHLARLGMSVDRAAELTGTARQELGRDPGRAAALLALTPASRYAREALPTASTTAGAIAAELARGDETFALRLLAHDLAVLASLDHPADRALSLLPPPSTGDVRWDALLAAATRRQCRLSGWPAPAWTRCDPLERWWFVAAPPLLRARTVQRTPPELGKLGIWITADALRAV
ncbi:hypothetical protein [Kineococcus glutinatus]|uniref:Uncharacterized protein n=1 Tax=Kineococcus glutinatus TaxID=1070872 RepID=A0ABP9HCZ0_9ACTN